MLDVMIGRKPRPADDGSFFFGERAHEAKERMTQIVLEENDRLDWAIKTFRRRVQRSGVLKELRQKRYFVKPSAAKRLKAAAARRRRRAEARRAARASR